MICSSCKRFEQAFANSLVFGRSDDSFWIGLNDQARGGSYRWLTGDEVSYTNWNRDQPGGCSSPECHTTAVGKTGRLLARCFLYH